MDNLTHTLISAMIGEVVHRSVPPSTTMPESRRRNAAIGVMVIGGNLPDADVLYTAWAGTTLDYLLHHRGHTHTIVGALALSVVLYLGVRLWWRLRRVRPDPTDVRLVAGLSLLATALHIGLDYTNSYGVHPFWPVDDRWYYGDAIFIIEPLIWASSAVLLFTLRSTFTRTLVALVLTATVGLSWFSGLVPAPLAALVTLLTVGLAALARTVSARAALAAGIAAWLAVTAVFAATGRAAQAEIDTILDTGFPTARTLDVVLTPTPANPVCREMLTVQLDGDRYVVRAGFHSLAPGWITADRCAALALSGTRTAPLAPVDRASTPEIAWTGELSMPADLLASLARDGCAAEALLQFARVPWATPSGDGWVLGDLRYDREPGPGFAEIDIGPSGDTCPRLGAPWVPPRQDLLRDE